jgi:hypothetical protein
MATGEHHPSRSREQADAARRLEEQGYRSISQVARAVGVHDNVARIIRVLQGYDTMDIHTTKYLKPKDATRLAELAARYRANEARLYPGGSKPGKRKPRGYA